MINTEKQERKLKRIRRVLTTIFLSVPVISATISAFHVEAFLRLGNPTFLSVSTAFAYEVANVGTMLILVLMTKINMKLMWWSFSILIFMQIIGNVYFSFDYIYVHMEENPYHVQNFIRMFRTFTDFLEDGTIIFILSCLVGAPVPIVALLVTKATAKNFEMDTNYPPEKEGETWSHDEEEESEEEEEKIAVVIPKLDKDDEGSGVVVRH